MKMAKKLTIVAALLMAAGCSHHRERYSESTYSPNYGYAGTSTYSGSSSSSTAGTSAQATQPSDQTTSSATATATTPSAGTGGDQGLSTQIQQSLKNDPTLASIAPQIQVSAQGGTVTLSGNVSSEQEKQRIESMVKSTTGVVNVNNQLQVSLQPTSDKPGSRLYHENKTDTSSPDSTSPQSSTTSPQSTTSSQQSSATSQTSQNDLTSAQTPPSATQTTPSTPDTTSSATGATTATNQSTAATSPGQSQDLTPTSERPESRVYSTNQTAGAQAGESFSTSIQATTASDKSLGSRIIQELRADTALAATLPMIKVAVDSGKITLTGTVKSQDEKQKIESAVQRVTGVSNVDNQLQVSSNPAATDSNSAK